jgi:hypothetical protein
MLDKKYICGNVFPSCREPDYIELNTDEYIGRVLSTKPDQIKDNNFIDNLYKTI